MCTAATYLSDNFYFGRTLDYEFSYGEEVTVTPRCFPLKFHFGQACEKHLAIIGMAHISQGYPLYYDAANEKGLCMAGLNFVGNAKYPKEPQEGKTNIAQYEFIPFVLSQCETLSSARSLLQNAAIIDAPFSEQLPTAQLHWIIADRTGAIVVESVADGLKVYDNPAGVLTNNPPFDYQLFALNNYMALSPDSPQNTFSKKLDLKTYSRGMGGIGLPGDLSSQSRFIRAAFVRANSISEKDESSSVSQFFHILGSVDQPRGCCALGEKYEITIYTSCMNADKGIYYYNTYDNRRISAVDMRRENLDESELSRYPIGCPQEDIRYIN